MAPEELILTSELAGEIERALDAAAANRIASAGRGGVPLGVETRRFGPIAATLVRHPRWYYGYFGGISGLTGDDWDAFDAGLAWLRSESGTLRTRVSPYSSPPGGSGRLLAALDSRGLAPSGFMSVLYGPATKRGEKAASGFQVRRARADDLEAFLDVWLASLEEPERSSLRPLPRAEFSDWQSYVACAEDRPAGVGSLFIAGQIGVLAAAVTLPHFRGRGIQSALLRRRIGAAARAGCDLVVSQATPGTISERNMQRAGLRPAFVQLMLEERPAPETGRRDVH